MTIPNPGVQPTQPERRVEPEIITPQTEPDVLGGSLAGEKQPKPFNLPDKGAGGAAGVTGASQEQISPMELAQNQLQKTSPQEISERINYLNNQFGKLNALLQKNPNITFPQNKANELNNTMGGLHEDLRTIAKLTNSTYTPPKDSGNLMQFVKDFVSGGQSQFNQALQYLGKIKNPNPAEMLRLSYTVQRASQKVELFSSIISSTVSGIKSIMGTQLG